MSDEQQVGLDTVEEPQVAKKTIKNTVKKATNKTAEKNTLETNGYNEIKIRIDRLTTVVKAQTILIEELKNNTKMLFDGLNQVYKTQEYSIGVLAAIADYGKDVEKKDKKEPNKNGVFNPKGK